MTRNKRRHKTGFSYIGAGNSASVFNRKPKRVFSKVKNELNDSSLKKHKLKFSNRELSEEQKEQIKKDIRTKNKHKNILTFILSILILVPIIFGIIAVIEGILSNNN